MEDIRIGKFLDSRYEILEQVGCGGMADVYRAKCHCLNRMVAVKVLKSDLAKDAEFRRRFHDESQAVAMLSHPNIVSVYDVSRSSELEYIVMELIDGITLKQYMQQKGGPLNWREALHFITQITKALGHAHSRGIIHRDIKPHNIMVLRDGSVKVADFGIARLTTDRQSTLTQEALGSVHYISPEQAKGSHIDARSDLYSAGVVLYEMLTGRLPFEGDSPVSVAIQHINSIPLPPRELNADIPDALEAITMQAMAPSAAQRYGSADEMLEDLEAFRKNPNINFDYNWKENQFSGAVDEPTRPIPTTRPSRRGLPEDEEEEEMFHTAQRRKKANGLSPLLLGVGALLIFFIGIGYFIWVTFLSGLMKTTVQYTVPNLVGKTLSEVQMDSGVTAIFTIQQGESVFNEDAPAGEIVFQSPTAGEKREEGEDLTIVVQVSAGQETILMEDLAGMEYREALLKVQGMGLSTDSPDYVSSETVAKGHVISYSPQAGQPMLGGDIVHLIVSTGPEIRMTTVASFTGVDVEKAKAMIAQNNLTIGEITPVEDMALPGVVLKQSEREGTEVVEGTVIHLTISAGPGEEPTPTPTPVPTPTPTPSTTPPPADSPVESTPEPPEVSDTPVVAPTAPPTPTPTPSYKTIPVDLGGGDGTVQITITVGDKTAYDNMAGRDLGAVNITVPGVGIQEVKVYLDGVLVDTRMVDFSI